VCGHVAPGAIDARHRPAEPARHLAVCGPPVATTAATTTTTAAVREYGWAWLFEDLLGHPAGAADGGVSPPAATGARAG
jgi:hypothetical protein